jgi:hypothetical protein
VPEARTLHVTGGLPVCHLRGIDEMKNHPVKNGQMVRSRQLLCLIILVCAVSPSGALSDSPLPSWELCKGGFYFRVNGIPSFVLGRNPTERTIEAFDRDFGVASANGEKIVRVHLMHGIPPNGSAGQVDEPWAAKWDRVFDAAERHGIAVIPVFTIWAQWNDGSQGEFWHVWDDNPYHTARGGPARSPGELLLNTECRRQWLAWLGALVQRWRGHACIVAWEPISEIDLVTGATPQTAAAFIVRAATAIRHADPQRRPVTVSLSGIVDWPEVNGSRAVDIVQTHPYGEHPQYLGNLSEMIVDSVRDRLRKYGKPVLIGECGLDARPPARTFTLAEHAPIGIRHALWASVVSGAMNGRMLWWEDGYDKYEHADIAGRYEAAAAPMARFVTGISFKDIKPADVMLSKNLKGAALASNKLIVGWFRDARCNPPDWPVRRLSAESVALPKVGGKHWTVQFYDTLTGKPMSAVMPVDRQDGVVIELPQFSESVALIASR